ncbi:MAG: NUDIX hydrolase [Candidatus Binatus sp.]|uniref:NUDIX hydrolase n=1 Tax=Candidatus Binatus sp. TaxID=2811406 RepID=UPI002720D422|nr:NUDIX hydrolase [Candidatus Binatus sp.]MDO8431296.1 NUDIX hydrolase [Candidatus Binatus sp.]
MNSKRRPILKLGVVDLGVESASLPNGVQVDLAVIRHPGAAAIVALDDDMNIATLSQYRYAIDAWMWEIPAGCRNPGEDFFACAQRELGEEAGVAAARWDRLGSIVTIPSFCDERIEVYLARELSAGVGVLDHDEVIRVSKVPFTETFEMIRRGDIVDAKSIAALYRARDFLDLERRP